MSGSRAGVTEGWVQVGLYTGVSTCGPSFPVAWASSRYGGRIPRSSLGRHVLRYVLQEHRAEGHGSLWPSLRSSWDLVRYSSREQSEVGPGSRGEDYGCLLSGRSGKEPWGVSLDLPFSLREKLSIGVLSSRSYQKIRLFLLPLLDFHFVR